SGDLDSPYQSFVTFEDDSNKPHHVKVTKIKVTELPAKLGFTRFSFGSIKGFCRVEDAISPECKESSNAAFVNNGTWFLGDRGSLETMAKTVASPRDELSGGVAALKEAASQTDGLPIVRLSGNPKSTKEFFLAPCQWGAFQS